MHRFQRVHRASQSRQERNATPKELAQTAMRRFEPGHGMIASPKLPETGFLLDWLSGGEGFERKIPGFSLRFESSI